MRDLRTLIQASGYSGVTGQSFRNHVTGSGTGTAMSDYFIGGLSWNSYPAAPPTTYADDAVLTVSCSFAQFGNKADLIKNATTTAWGVSPTNINGGTGDNASLDSVGWAGNVATLNIRLRGCYTPGLPTPSSAVWYLGYTDPALPYTNPDYSGWSVQFTADGGSVAASGTGSMYVNISHTPDKYAAGFNPVYSNAAVLSNFTVSVDRRVDNPALEWQWAAENGFTTPTTQYGYTFSYTHPSASYNGSAFSAWARYRLSGSSGGYTSYGGTGEIPWTDPRLY